MKKNHFFILIIAQFFVAVFLHAEEFVDKRFYQTFNPRIVADSWVRFTPESVIEDKSLSYWYAPIGVKPNILETKCKLLENKIGYIKYKCPKDGYIKGHVEVVISNCGNKYFPYSLVAYVRKESSRASYWIPDGSSNSSAQDSNKLYTYDNNNIYKECPLAASQRKTTGCDYISDLLWSRKFKYSDLVQSQEIE